MKKNLALILIVMICIGLVGCGSQDDEDTQEVSAMSDTEDEIVEAASEDNTEIVEEDSSDDEPMDDDQEASENDLAADEEPEDIDLPLYEVSELDEPTIMYASDSVNVRQGPSTDFEIIGFLRPGRDVTVTGQADTGWYEILYNEEKAFVSDKYLLDEMPVLQAEADTTSETETEIEADMVLETETVSDSQPQEKAEITPVTEVKNVAGVIFVGDSRFVQMKNSVGENPCTWIAESSKGYKWLNDTALARIDNCVGKGSKILINLGVNDPGNIQKYLALVNAKADEWTSKGATVYYSSVNPVWENPYVTEEQVVYFNSQLQSGLSSNVHWIDSHTYLNTIGYKLVDGLHYNSETYQNLYAYYMSCM